MCNDIVTSAIRSQYGNAAIDGRGERNRKRLKSTDLDNLYRFNTTFDKFIRIIAKAVKCCKTQQCLPQRHRASTKYLASS